METSRVLAMRARNWSLGLNFGTRPTCSGSPISVAHPECWDGKLTNTLTYLWAFLYSSSDGCAFDWVSCDQWRLVAQNLVKAGRHSVIHFFCYLLLFLMPYKANKKYLSILYIYLLFVTSYAHLAWNKYIFCFPHPCFQSNFGID